MSVAIAVAGWAVVYATFAGAAVARSVRLCAPRHGSARASRMVVVRPCAGDEPGLLGNLLSTARALRRVTGSVRIRFTAVSASDPAFTVAQDAAGRLRRIGYDARACVAPTAAANRKAGQLASITQDVTDEEAVVVADSDVDLTGVDLERVVDPLFAASNPAAAVWCAPVEDGPEVTFADRLSAGVLGGSLQAFVLLRGIDRESLVGKVFAVRGDALRRAGGFAAMADRLGEDVELSRRLRGQGATVAVSPTVVRSVARGRSLASVFARYVRWLVVVRAQRPSRFSSYPLLVAAAPLIVVAGLWATGPWGLAAVAIATVTRLAVAVSGRRLAGRRWSTTGVLIDALLIDPLLIAAWLRAGLTRRVAWRQRSLWVRRGGQLVAHSEA